MRPDWFHQCAARDQSAPILKGKVLGGPPPAGLLILGHRHMDHEPWLNQAGPPDRELSGVCTRSLNLALQRGSLARQSCSPLAVEAQLSGYPTFFASSNGKPLPPVFYVVNRQWRHRISRPPLSRAIGQRTVAARSLNPNEAIAILQIHQARESLNWKRVTTCSSARQLPTLRMPPSMSRGQYR